MQLFKNFDDESFKQKLAETNLTEVLECTDVDKAAELLVQKLTSVLDNMAPIKTVQTRKRYAPCLTDETKKLGMLLRRRFPDRLTRRLGPVQVSEKPNDC